MPPARRMRRRFNHFTTWTLLALALVSTSCWERDAELVVSVNSIDFGNQLARIEFVVENGGEDRTLTAGVKTLEYTIKTDQPWVTVHPPSGSCGEGEEITHVVKLDRTAIEIGNNVANITISSNFGSKKIPVRAYRDVPGCVLEPTAPWNPTPADDATTASVNADLVWSDGVSQCAGLTATYDVYFGTTSPPPFSHDNGTVKSWDPGTLAFRTTYYWRIVAKDANGVTSGAEWSFRTESSPCTAAPTAPANTDPADDAIDVPTAQDLSWTGGTSQCEGLTATYDVYFGTTSPPVFSHNNGTSKTWDPGALAERATYYWRIVARDANGSTTGPEWNFRTLSTACTLAPTAPAVLVPLDDATGVAVMQELSWSAGISQCAGLTATYDVYFGTVSPPPFSHDNGSAKSWSPGPLSTQTTYYWRVVARDANGSTTGPEWNFRTVAACATPPSVPATPAPAAGATAVPVNQDLAWSAGTSQCAGLTATYDVYFGTTSPPPFSHSNGTAQNWEPGPLAFNTSYYWRIVAKDANGSTTGPEWSFRTEATPCTLAPTVPWGPAPAHNGTGIALDANLAWNGGISQCPNLTATYDVYFGTTSPPPFSHNNGNVPSWDPGALAGGTTYYWRIVAKDANGSTSSSQWNFTTVPPTCTAAPTAPTGPAPAAGATGVGIGQDLSWTAGISQCAGLTATYDVYFGTTSPPPFSHNNGTAKTWDAGTLAYETTYYWRVVARDANGATSGAEWSFTTAAAPCVAAPTAIAAGFPAGGATGVSLTQDLSWTGGNSQCAGLTATYDVYFGTSPTPSFSHDNGTAKSWDPGVLSYSTTYYWQIVAKDANGSTPGPVWSFTTESPCLAAPTAPCTPNPTNGRTNANENTNLAWGCGDSQCVGLTATYDVYFGTDPDPAFRASSASKSLTLPPLAKSTKYYWRVVARDANGSTSGPVWNFTTRN